ncbi:hypothetical protein MGN70_012395 [Eutypa lata]|nr:hypothetical protein MGN70_012395 [Eutypa lata]
MANTLTSQLDRLADCVIASADRRPVDPPPVLQFKVLEGENFEAARDITFDYNADFFVFASLEHARPMAHGRVQTPAATSPPVLTGFPVAGCCYLDRPAPAGYFIFPDLSVRHEGRYRLVFTLYEQIKDEQDEEIEPRGEDREGIAGEDDGQGFYHRMEVKSDDFAVFSAKKFPGLSESTALSRTVAEQGCRVRIRRDVRMRRRDNKPSAGADYDDNAEDDYTRRRRTQTPEVLRPRSVSNTSMDGTQYGHDHSRRPSNADYGHHAPPPPPMYQANQSGRILSFGHGGQDCAPPVYAPPPPPAPLSTPVSPAHPASFHPSGQVSSYPPPPSPGFITPQSGYYERPPSSHEQEVKMQPTYNYPSSTMKPLAPMPSTPISRSSRGSVGSAILPSITAIERDRNNSIAWSSRSDSFAKPGPLYSMREPQPTKRSHDDVFQATQERTVNGQRPEVNYQDPRDPNVAWYKRANLEWKQRPFIV